MSDSDVLRRGLLALATLSVAATALELAMLRHWTTVVQVIPFAILGLTAVAIALAARATRGRLQAARALGAVAALSSLYGVLVALIA